MEPARTALVIAVPEAEPAVARHRARLDRSATWGVPAHITVIWPFLPPADIDEDVHTTVARVAAGVPGFHLTLRDIGWFGDRVVWLAPDPAAPLRTLTTELSAQFPQAPPYEGAHPDIVPHLTLGHDHPVADLRAAAAATTTRLPIHARITHLRLITGIPAPGGPWTTITEYPLGR